MTGVYDILHLDSNKEYVNETSRDLKKRINEYIMNLKIKHILENNYDFDSKDSKMLVNIHYEKRRKTVK